VSTATISCAHRTTADVTGAAANSIVLAGTLRLNSPPFVALMRRYKTEFIFQLRCLFAATVMTYVAPAPVTTFLWTPIGRHDSNSRIVSTWTGPHGAQQVSCPPQIIRHHRHHAFALFVTDLIRLDATWRYYDSGALSGTRGKIWIQRQLWLSAALNWDRRWRRTTAELCASHSRSHLHFARASN